MSFYKWDKKMLNHISDLIEKLAKEGRPNLQKNISITWIHYKSQKPEAGSGIGAAWAQNKLFYPASVIKLIYGIATEIWLNNDLIVDSTELQRALSNMLAESSNDATSYIVDILTGTNSGPFLKEERWESWKIQRQLINKWLKSLNWSELEQINCCQKTWTDGPYGRDRKFYGERNENRNALTTNAIGRILEELMTGHLLSKTSSKNIKDYLSRSLDLEQRKENPENQIDGFLGAGLPKLSNLWSKAGWMSQVRHDAAWLNKPDENPMLLVVFSKGKELSNDNFLLPSIAAELYKLHEEMNQIN